LFLRSSSVTLTCSAPFLEGCILPYSYFLTQFLLYPTVGYSS
jgi:hypothetical protein